MTSVHLLGLLDMQVLPTTYFEITFRFYGQVIFLRTMPCLLLWPSLSCTRSSFKHQNLTSVILLLWVWKFTSCLDYISMFNINLSLLQFQTRCTWNSYKRVMKCNNWSGCMGVMSYIHWTACYWQDWLYSHPKLVSLICLFDLLLVPFMRFTSIKSNQ